MLRIFLLGDQDINGEIRTHLSGKADFTHIPEPAVDLVIDSCSFPRKEKKKNIQAIDRDFPASVPVLTSSVCTAVSEQCSFSKYPERLIGIGLYRTFSESKLTEIAPSKVTDAKMRERVKEILSQLGIDYAIVPDVAGLVFPRIIAMIMNEAAQLCSEETATREDIDTAMKLGTNYPYGPLEWADRMGIDLVYNILVALQNYFGEDRYRPHPILREMVNLKQLGVKTGRGFYEY
jgi:3-hydroxybutyryl-CoA dehydrogenase